MQTWMLAILIVLSIIGVASIFFVIVDFIEDKKEREARLEERERRRLIIEIADQVEVRVKHLLENMEKEVE